MYNNRIVSDSWSFLRQVSYHIGSDSGGLGIVSIGIVSELFEYRTDFGIGCFLTIVSYRIGLTHFTHFTYFTHVTVFYVFCSFQSMAKPMAILFIASFFETWVLEPACSTACSVTQIRQGRRCDKRRGQQGLQMRQAERPTDATKPSLMKRAKCVMSKTRET